MLKGKAYQEREVTDTKQREWELNYKKEKTKVKTDQVDTKKKELVKAMENKRKALIKKETNKMLELQMRKVRAEQEILRRRELQLLKKAETYENAEIARKVRAYQKRQLIDKQLEADE